MTYENLIVEVKDRIARVTVNRPKLLNALNEKTVREIHAAFSALRHEPAVGAVILAGSGEKAFIAGADINELAVMKPLHGEASWSLGQADRGALRDGRRDPRPGDGSGVRTRDGVGLLLAGLRDGRHAGGAQSLPREAEGYLHRRLGIRLAGSGNRMERVAIVASVRTPIG